MNCSSLLKHKKRKWNTTASFILPDRDKAQNAVLLGAPEFMVVKNLTIILFTLRFDRVIRRIAKNEELTFLLGISI